MQIERVLVIDDELLMREFLSESLQRLGCEVTAAPNGAEGVARLQEGAGFDLVLTDLRMDGMGGLEVLAAVREKSPRSLVAVITAHAEMEAVAEALNGGAFDYLTKPLSPSQVQVLLAKAAQHRTLVEENTFYREASARADDGFDDLVGRSDPMREVLKVVSKVAPSSATVLVTGESGTGKELIARAIHRRSDRASRPFIRVNCAALPETLLESELFGHERGAFTGALERRAGRFELAHTGTLLLDEISETSLALQSKLLRVLQEREFERVGGNKTLQVDVRVICTSNRDLKQAVKEGRFREDLYYRLNVVPIELPALRARDQDILLLAEYFARRFTARHNKKSLNFTEDGRAALLQYRWPGNVRELENTIERAVLLGEGTALNAQVLNLPATEAAAEAAPGQEPSENGLAAEISGLTSLAEIERRVIIETMRVMNGNRTKAAIRLGISVRTLYSKLREYEAMGRIEQRQNSLAEVS
ncbi:MAG: sigma-54-dependent Fis family transcriptional regulator [Planctomycetes bacterium]|nr:sigma-54-dependent Fis family transcriptional regulator [Planctomycetota bacterium]